MKKLFAKITTLLIFCFLATAADCHKPLAQAQYYLQIHNCSKDTLQMLKVSGQMTNYSYEEKFKLTDKQFSTTGELQQLQPNVVYQKLTLQFTDSHGKTVIDTVIDHRDEAELRVTHFVTIQSDTTFNLETVVTGL